MDKGYITWYGKPVTELSRDELLEALEFASSELARHQTPKAIRANSLGAVEMMKRGERRYG